MHKEGDVGVGLSLDRMLNRWGGNWTVCSAAQVQLKREGNDFDETGNI